MITLDLHTYTNITSKTCGDLSVIRKSDNRKLPRDSVLVPAALRFILRIHQLQNSKRTYRNKRMNEDLWLHGEA
jgi:hypothetical protein